MVERLSYDSGYKPCAKGLSRGFCPRSNLIVIAIAIAIDEDHGEKDAGSSSSLMEKKKWREKEIFV